MKHEESDLHGKLNPPGRDVALMEDYCMTVLVKLMPSPHGWPPKGEQCGRYSADLLGQGAAVTLSQAAPSPPRLKGKARKQAKDAGIGRFSNCRLRTGWNAEGQATALAQDGFSLSSGGCAALSSLLGCFFASSARSRGRRVSHWCNPPVKRKGWLLSGARCAHVIPPCARTEACRIASL